MGKSKVFILTDSKNRVTRLEGGYTTPADVSGWVLIDEGFGDKFNLCQTHYLPRPITEERGLCVYKYENGAVVERTQAEIDADYDPEQIPTSPEERIAELEAALSALLEGTV